MKRLLEDLRAVVLTLNIEAQRNAESSRARRMARLVTRIDRALVRLENKT
jgi:hypothetical protein